MAAINTLTDDFSGTTLDTTKWTDTSTTGTPVTVSGGKLHLPTNNAAANTFSQITSATTYTFASVSIYARVVPSTTTNVRTSLIVADTGVGSSGNVEMYYLNGLMYARAFNANGTVSQAPVVVGTWDQVTWNYWHLTFGGTTITIGKSSDSTTVGNTATVSGTSTWSANVVATLAVTAAGGQANETLIDSVNVKSPADNITSTLLPRMRWTRTTPTAQRTTSRTAASTPRTVISRSQAGNDGTATRNTLAMSGTRMTYTRAPAISQTISGTGTSTVITRPTTGLLWPPAGAWARR